MSLDFNKKVENATKLLEELQNDNYSNYSLYVALLITRFSLSEGDCVEDSQSLPKKFTFSLILPVGLNKVFNFDRLGEWKQKRIEALLESLKIPSKEFPKEIKQTLENNLRNSFDKLLLIIFKEDMKWPSFSSKDLCKYEMNEILRLLDYLEIKYYNSRFKQAYISFVKENLLNIFDGNVNEARKGLDKVSSFLNSKSYYKATELGSKLLHYVDYIDNDIAELSDPLERIGTFLKLNTLATRNHVYLYYIYPKPILDGSLSKSLKIT